MGAGCPQGSVATGGPWPARTSQIHGRDQRRDRRAPPPLAPGREGGPARPPQALPAALAPVRERQAPDRVLSAPARAGLPRPGPDLGSQGPGVRPALRPARRRAVLRTPVQLRFEPPPQSPALA